MCTTEKILPPNVNGKTQGCLEIEVSQINFLYERSNINNRKNKKQKFNNKRFDKSKGLIAKLVWWGENIDNAASVQISCVKEEKKNQKQHAEINKLRYNICSLVLFLDYLRTCGPIEILIFSSFSNLQLGQASFRLPDVLLRKYATNYTNGCTFEYKTKIYALYKNGSQQQKTGEIQLRFRMLFAPSAKHAQTALQEQMTTLQFEHEAHSIKLDAIASGHEKKSHCKVEKVLRPPTAKPEDIVQAMKKLDANLVAYLSKDDVSVDDSFNLKQFNSASSISQLLSDTEEDREQQMLQAFKSVSAIKLQLEALTLQPEGTKRMELMQSEIRPIFTIECQLSNELIKYVPRYDLFHVMQFESEKFQSLTQCTRFGQEAKRNIKMLNENDYDEQGNLNFGRIHYTVWWREPGTCLNEMLGMGVLELVELYNASLLEQCKCITINRRGIHLASLYLKISLLIENQSSLKKSAEMINLQRILKETTTKQCNGDNEEEEKKGTSQINLKSNVVQSNNKPQFEDTANPAQNNNIELHSTNFTAETSKVRLLKGFIYANEARNLDDVQNYEYFLVCRRFWHEEIATAVGTAIEREVNFKYQEQFAVINDEKFLRRVEKQFLRLEVWRRMINDGNGNKDSMWLLGVVHLPLHQFYIAYRDSTITNHVCKGKLPVISVDAWVPLLKNKTTEKVGELKCLLAVGSEEQINTLKENRGFTAIAHNSLEIDNALFTVPSCSGNNVDSVAAGTDSTSNPKLKNVTDLLDMLQKALNQPPVAKSTTELQALTQKPTSSNIKPLAETNANSFKFILDIQCATGLPLNPPAKGRKALKNTSAISKRYPPNEAPSTYVTFQADEGYDKLYKSHEGMVYATNIIEKSTHPEWVQRFHVSATTEYLTNPKKLFILKIWKKALTNNEHTRGQPTPMEDAIIGFSALDLTALLTKLRVSGWFNIVDFNGRINGQIKINCQQSADLPTTARSPESTNLSKEALAPNVDAVIDQFENTLDLTHMNLGQAIKRKFTELEEISQRLRTRLTDVTGEQIASTFDVTALDNWESMHNVKDDDFYLNEFEHDINTSVTEESGVISAISSNSEPEDKVTNVISSTFDIRRAPALYLNPLTSSRGVYISTNQKMSGTIRAQ